MKLGVKLYLKQIFFSSFSKALKEEYLMSLP